MKKLILFFVLVLSGCAAGTQTPTRTPTAELLIYPRRATEAPYPTAPIRATLTAIALRNIMMPTATATPFYHYPQNFIPPTQTECIKIKGNNSANGKIYHCPTWRDYDKTTVKENEGDRWFCSEDEARAAGFREPDYAHGSCR